MLLRWVTVSFLDSIPCSSFSVLHEPLLRPRFEDRQRVLQQESCAVWAEVPHRLDHPTFTRFLIRATCDIYLSLPFRIVIFINRNKTFIYFGSRASSFFEFEFLNDVVFSSYIITSFLCFFPQVPTLSRRGNRKKKICSPPAFRES